ncbi:MAG: signal peptidase II [Gammaproteobacteria bacterium]|jgi:signal peptidase II
MWRWLWLSAIVVVLDQLTKQWIEEAFVLYESLPVTGFFNLTLVYNTGAAFSFLADAGGWQRWFFLILALLICVYLVYWLLHLDKKQVALPLAIAMIIGGAVGNVIDRLLHGHVIDFLDFYYQQWHWPAFNLADSAITLGVILFIWDAFFGAKDNSDA